MANAQALSEELAALHAQLETIEDAKTALDSNSTVCTTMQKNMTSFLTQIIASSGYVSGLSGSLLCFGTRS